MSDVEDTSRRPDDPAPKLPAGLSEAVRQSAKASELLRQSAMGEHFKEVTRLSKLADQLAPKKQLVESMARLSSLKVDLPPLVSKSVIDAAAARFDPPETRPLLITNPVHETNKRLGELIGEVNSLATTQNEMIGVLESMVGVQRQTDRKTFWLVFFAALSIVLALLLALR